MTTTPLERSANGAGPRLLAGSRRHRRGFWLLTLANQQTHRKAQGSAYESSRRRYAAALVAANAPPSLRTRQREREACRAR